jgi:hypothetical protein
MDGFRQNEILAPTMEDTGVSIVKLLFDKLLQEMPP